MALLREVCQWGVGFDISKAHAMPSSLFLPLLSCDQDVTLGFCPSTMSAAMLPHDDDVINL